MYRKDSRYDEMLQNELSLGPRRDTPQVFDGIQDNKSICPLFRSALFAGPIERHRGVCSKSYSDIASEKRNGKNTFLCPESSISYIIKYNN